ncbi:MAG TPA: hypothetical protein DDY04_06955 [Bacteroidales bacterium]|nr:hypothetical protein [Bacteroidales bacterium]
MDTFEQFIEAYDKPGTVILLEGKRAVSPVDQGKLSEVGKLLARSTMHIIFRSGNAGGADFYFSQGVTQVNPSRLQVITPYRGHRAKNNLGFHTISLDDIDLANEPMVIYHTRNSSNVSQLINSYLQCGNNSFTVKARYLLRDTVKVVGTSKLQPATLAIFYDDLAKPKTGGTGHTMRVCEKNGIPYIDQTVWFNWLEQ